MKKYLSNPYVIALLAGIVLILLVKFSTSISLIFNKMKSKIEVNKRSQTGTYAEVNLQEIADEIYIAFHEQFWGLREDETRAIRALVGAGALNVKAVALLYSKKGENLYTDFQKYLSEKEYLSVKHLLNA